MIKKIEDIYPLAIVSMRYSNKIIIFNSFINEDSWFIQESIENQLIVDNIEKWLNENVYTLGIKYGIGLTFNDAFENYKKRLK